MDALLVNIFKLFPIDIILLIAVIIVLLFLRKKRRVQKNNEKGKFPYKKNDVLFTPAERSFLGVLDQAVGNQFRIFGKVRLADIVYVNETSSRSEKTSAENKITRKHIDFVLCDKNNLEIICCIELNDKSHNFKNRRDRDEFVRKVCDIASIPLIMIKARRSYSISEIRNTIVDQLG